MTSTTPRHRSVLFAAMTASFLLLVLGLAYRLLVVSLSTPLSKTPIDCAALEGLPMQIGNWTGEGVPLDEDEAILGKIHAEESINRRYVRGDGAKSISLFVAASGTAGGTLVGDLPEVCNVLAGSRLVDQHYAKLALTGGTTLPCKILQFSRGSQLSPERRTVLYYYMAGADFYDNRSQLRMRVQRGPTMVHCIAQVQIVASSTESGPADTVTAVVSEFAVDSASAIAELFQRIEETQRSAQSRKAPEEG